jgi:diguanylate cyclase
MRYDQSRLQSAELLRLALARMGQHDAALNPLTFAVWYEHLAGINRGLSEAVERCLQGGARLDDDAVQTLHREHIAEIDEATAQRVSADFGRVMQRLSETAARTGDSASAFGQKLGDLQRQLREAEVPVSVSLVGDTIEWASRMQGSVASLQQQVATSRQEIERLRADLERTRDEALRCPLTGVLNRKGFDLKLQALLEQPQTTRAPGCLVMIDIDHFKRVNDNHGHLIGDRVLEGVGKVLQRIVDHSGAAVARYGGEEFALLLPDSSVARALSLTEDVLVGIRCMRIRQRTSDKTIVAVTVSAGVAALQAGDDAAALISRADEALYRSKQTGRDRVTTATAAAMIR